MGIKGDKALWVGVDRRRDEMGFHCKYSIGCRWKWVEFERAGRHMLHCLCVDGITEYAHS